MPKVAEQPKIQHWIYSPFSDSLFILLPPFLSLLVVVCFADYFRENAQMPTMAWFVLVLLVDVAHVYSTLYRTYFDRDTFQKQRSILLIVPFICWVVGVVIYSIDGMLFWRLMAYVAVFHFIRQQYGFMRIYSRKEKVPLYFKRIDTIAIYAATIYPILFWHLHPDRNFNWFLKGDFYYYPSALMTYMATIIYCLIVVVYAVKEVYQIITSNTINIPRIAIIAGTFLSWYFGIVYYNGDLIFTTLNVVSHGIPYMALVWIYGRKKYTDPYNPEVKSSNNPVKIFFSNYGIVLFLLIVFGLAYLEEGIWDSMVWHDHPELFSPFKSLPPVKDAGLLSFLVPLLALPQITHYVLDGFIWKMGKDSFNWKMITLGK